METVIVWVWISFMAKNAFLFFNLLNHMFDDQDNASLLFILYFHLIAYFLLFLFLLNFPLL
jgi:hypothetical protein